MLRYSVKATAVVQGGTSFSHGLGVDPDEWAVNLRGPTPGAAVLYVNAVTSASITVAASGADGTGDVFCSVSHSIIK